MELVLSGAIGVLVGSGVWLLMRPRTYQVIIGLALLSERGAKLVREVHAELARTHQGRFHEAESLSRAAFTDLLQELIDRGHTVTCVDVYKGWMEVDTFEDYRRAWSEIRA